MFGKQKVFALFCASLLTLGSLAAGHTEGAAPRALDGFFKQVRQQNDMGKDERGEYELLHQKWAGLAVDEDLRKSHPELAAAIERRTKADWERVQKNRREMTKEAKQFRQEVSSDYYRSYYQDMDVQMRRADEYVVSYLEMESTYSGGAHGMYAWHGVNLNSLSGEEIALSHVVKDTGKLTELIIKRLEKDYAHAYFEDTATNVRSYALQGKLNWTLDPRGITFYFNPYDIAPYAAGLLTVTILYQEAPQLFHESYLQVPQEYAQPFPSDYPLITSLGDNGRRDMLEVSDLGEKLAVVVNGQQTEWDTALKDLQPVLIHMKDKKNYLYVDGRTEDGSRQTVVFGIKNGKVQHIGTLPYTFRHVISVAPAEQEFWRFLTNPSGFRIDRNATAGNPSKTDICAVGADGQLTFG